MMSTATELAYRRNGDIAVGRYWDRPSGELNVFVADLASGETFEPPVAPDRALDGFHHSIRLRGVGRRRVSRRRAGAVRVIRRR